MEDKDLFEQPGKVMAIASILWLGVAVMVVCMALAIWREWV
jgi:hypothetical protein